MSIVYHQPVIRRLYVHNYRCLENFELPLAGKEAALFIGRNGSGKTTVGFALEILQKIGRGVNRVGSLVTTKDLGRPNVPVRFEIEADIDAAIFRYTVAFEFPEGFRELRIFEENLWVDGKPVYRRDVEKVYLGKKGSESQDYFVIDWHLVALSVIREHPSNENRLPVFRDWLSRMLVLKPVPALMKGDSEGDTLQPSPSVDNFGSWFSGLLNFSMSAQSRLSEYLREVMPDLADIKRPLIGESRGLSVHFSDKSKGTLTLSFEDLSDGEKCFMVCALVLAANDVCGPLVCFWDEPDNYLAPSEVGHFVLALRKAFQIGGQFLATSHNPEAISRFSDENTFHFQRNSHLEPTIVRPLREVRASGQIPGDLVDAMVRGDI